MVARLWIEEAVEYFDLGSGIELVLIPFGHY
jgi:hypothetical protein